MNTTNYIRIFRGDDSDALGYQTIVGTIKTDLDLTGCKAVFRFLGFYAEFDPIPEDKKLTIVVPAQASRGFPPGVGYASLKVIDAYGKIRTFTNRIPVIVDTMTPSCGCGEFEVSFSPFPELEPLKIFIGPNADDFDQYTGFVSKIIDRASLVKYGLVMLADAMGEDGGASGKAASPLAVKAAYDAIITTLTDNYYNAEQTEEAIDRVAAYYITRNAAGDAFETKAQLDSTTVFYSGGKVRTPTRNDYCVVLADETHDNAEYRYIYAVAEGQTTGSWQPQFPVEGVMTVDQNVTKNSQNPVSGGGVWSALWGALAALPTDFSSLYDWCVAQLADKLSTSGGTIESDAEAVPLIVKNKTADTSYCGIMFVTNGSDEYDAVGEVGFHFDPEDEDNGHVAIGTSSIHVKVPNNPEANDGTFALAAPNSTAGNLAALDASGNPTDSQIPAANVALKSAIPYDLGTPIVIDTASSEVVEGETVYYGAATLANRTANIVQVTTQLDELRITFPAANPGKVRDFGLRVEIGNDSAVLAELVAPALVPIAPPAETIKIENNAAEIPALADETATAKGVTLLYFSENAPGVFVVKGEQVEEVA